MSNEQQYYLRQNVQVEPLIDQWYAWPHLISPATAARNITERHMKLMDSYINAPQIHASAVKNPKMRGGPFIDYDGRRVDEIRALRDRIKAERAPLFDLSAALVSLDNMLRENARGFSLHPLYEKVPPILRGYVELVYDLNHHPSFRVIEPLLYKSRFYDKSQQSLMLSIISNDDRPFVLSTPRLESPASLPLALSFDNPVIDDLFRLKTSSRSLNEIKGMLQVPDEKDEVLLSLLTTEAPPSYSRYRGPGVRWRYFGHACILVETQNTSILFDPVLSYTYENGISRYTYLDLPEKIDYVVITHNHQDHILFETLLQIRHKVGSIVVPRNASGHLQDPSLKLMFQNCGFRNIIELGALDSVQNGNLQFTALPFFGEHADLDIQSKTVWHVSVDGHALLFAADSCNIEPYAYENIHNIVGDVDALFLGMECEGAPLSWLYGPLLTQKIDRQMDESRRLSGSNCEQGMKIVTCFNCRDVYVYAMGQEPWLNYISSIKYTAESKPIVESNKLLQECQERGIVAERLFGEKEILLTPRAATVPDMATAVNVNVGK